MTTVAVYLFFIAVLSGYRYSKYWPKEITGASWIGKYWINLGCMLLGLILLLINWGWTIGILLALCIYMATLSAVLLFTACNKKTRLVTLFLFHVLCLVGLIFKF